MKVEFKLYLGGYTEIELLEFDDETPEYLLQQSWEEWAVKLLNGGYSEVEE